MRVSFPFLVGGFAVALAPGGLDLPRPVRAGEWRDPGATAPLRSWRGRREPALTLEGDAGDIVVFDADLLHGATRNRSGARRRSFLLGFSPESDRPIKDGSRAIRNVRMDTSELFVP